METKKIILNFTQKFILHFRFIILDKIFFILAIFFFHFFPKQLYLLYKNKHIISPKDRLNRNQDILEDFFFFKKPEIIFNEINIIGKGESIYQFKRNIKLNIPTFMVNIYDNSSIKNFPYIGITFSQIQVKKSVQIYKFFKQNSYMILAARSGVIEKKNKNLKIFWDSPGKIFTNKTKIKKKLLIKLKKIVANGVIHRNTFRHFEFDPGGMLQAIILLGAMSKKINIYGWDHYLKNDVSKMKYSSILYALKGPNDKTAYSPRMKRYFGSSLINMFYAYKISKIKKYKIFSRLSNIKNQKKLISRLHKVFLASYN